MSALGEGLFTCPPWNSKFVKIVVPEYWSRKIMENQTVASVLTTSTGGLELFKLKTGLQMESPPLPMEELEPDNETTDGSGFRA